MNLTTEVSGVQELDDRVALVAHHFLPLRVPKHWHRRPPVVAAPPEPVHLPQRPPRIGAVGAGAQIFADDGGPTGAEQPGAIEAGGRDGNGERGAEALKRADDEDAVRPGAREGDVEVEVLGVPVVRGGDRGKGRSGTGVGARWGGGGGGGGSELAHH